MIVHTAYTQSSRETPSEWAPRLTICRTRTCPIALSALYAEYAREFKPPLEAESSGSAKLFLPLNQAALGRLHSNASQHTTVVHR